ncbi:branched-chain amino acid ABC transporter ATP-binding protein/permease [Tardiphaga sp. 862_B3_N4_1]|uniref:branched-chain amino acid ABC transporter ATP-binding protein/permease n=1 Tax=Tardiphaga sp. 862_B3_N4_1 TaxID=3240764 RepID=UPI003F23EC4A
MKFIPAIVLVGLIIAAGLTPSYYAGLATYAAVLALLGLSVNVTLGYLGLISFGHAAFFGVGAYTAGLLSVNLGLNYWAAIPIAIIPGVILGVFVGFASLRLAGPYFAIATLATAEIFRLVALNWVSLTRGPLGIIVPRPRIPAFEAAGLTFAQYHLIICLIVVAFVLLALKRLVNSPYGRAWFALRDQPNLAESIGIAGLKFRILAIALSGGIAALAGALLVPKILVLSPDLFGLSQSSTGLLAAILGGRGMLLGPVVGGIIFAILPETLRFVDEYRIAIFALILLLVVRLRPEGLLSLLPVRSPAGNPRGKSDVTIPASEPKRQTLAIKGLSRSFGGLKAVQDVSFSITPGEIVGIIGPNGAGKTTSLSLISGFVSPTSGSVIYGAHQIGGLPPHEIAALGLVRTFQHTALCPGLSAFENVMIASHLLFKETLFAALFRSRSFVTRELARAAWATACLDKVGLSARADEPAGTMAYGEQRMLSIAVAIAARPDILFLDEPAAGLNHTEALRLADVLRKLRDEGMTLAVVDHNLRMLMSFCDRLVVLHHGKKLAEGDPVAVRNMPDVVKAYLGEKRLKKEVAHA